MLFDDDNDDDDDDAETSKYSRTLTPPASSTTKSSDTPRFCVCRDSKYMVDFEACVTYTLSAKLSKKKRTHIL